MIFNGMASILKALTHPATSALLGGLVLPTAMDYRMNSDPNAKFGISTWKDLVGGTMSKDRKFNLAVNGLLGAGGGALMNTGIGRMFTSDEKLRDVKGGATMLAEGVGTMALAPAKDLILNALSTPDKMNKALDKITETTSNVDTSMNKLVSRLGLGALGIGAGALGLGGYGLYKWLQAKKKDQEREEKGHIKIRVRGKDGDPNKTMDVVLPVDSPDLSPTLMEGLNMSLRRNAKDVIRANSMKRDPETGKMITYEAWAAKYGRGKKTDATGTPTMNVPSSDGYSYENFGKAAFWDSADDDEKPEENPAQTPESTITDKPILLRKVTGPTLTEYFMPNSATLTPALIQSLLNEMKTPMQKARGSYEATGSPLPDSFDDEDDEFDKMSAAGPDGGGGGGGAPPQGANVPPDMNQQAQGLPPAGSSTAVSEASSRLTSILDRLKQQRNSTGFKAIQRPQGNGQQA